MTAQCAADFAREMSCEVLDQVRTAAVFCLTHMLGIRMVDDLDGKVTQRFVLATYRTQLLVSLFVSHFGFHVSLESVIRDLRRQLTALSTRVRNSPCVWLIDSLVRDANTGQNLSFHSLPPHEPVVGPRVDSGSAKRTLDSD